LSIRLIDELTDNQIDDLHEMYRNEWWTETRGRGELPKMLANSDELVAFEDSDSRELVSFARVLTDYTYKALIFDVIVAGSQRGQGLGERLMEEILDHPQLVDVEHFELYCLEELAEFYEQWGFTAELGSLRLMRC
jgi:GNAT superfamily N-acetyltransferase